MITILHVIESLAQFGGTPRKMLYLVKHTDSSQYKHIFLCLKNSDLSEELSAYGATTINLHTVSPIQLILKITAHAKRLKPDVICTHFTRSLITGYFTAKFLGIPVIHNEHGPATLRVRPKTLSKRIALYLEKHCLTRADIIINNSMYTRNTIADAFSPNQMKLRVNYNPVEMRESTASSTVTPELPPNFKTGFAVGHIGGMTEWRDQASLITAIGLLKEKHPDIRLIMIGEGPLKNELETLVKELGIEQHVLFVGYTNYVADYLKLMAVYVNPALEEGFGIAVVEAMLAGIPVLLSDKGAHPELIEPGHSGLLYTGGNPDALAEKLQWLLINQEERAKIGIEGKLHAECKFSPEKYSQNYITIIDEVIGSRIP